MATIQNNNPAFHRLDFARHFWRSKKEIIHGGRQCTTYISTLEKDTGITKGNLPNVMGNTSLWRQIVENARMHPTGYVSRYSQNVQTNIRKIFLKSMRKDFNRL